MSDQVRIAEQLRIEALGGLSIWLDQRGSAANDDKAQRLHFDARSAEALLVYLACQGRVLARDTLAELFWPDRSQEQARTNLRGCLHRLRQQLGPYLLITRQSVALDFDASITVDSLELETDCARGHYAAAAALYKADFLDGFYMDGSPAFEQWALTERERLRNLVISACQQLVNQATANGQLEAAIGYGERLLQLDPLHEPIHRQLMRLLAQAGRRTAALAQYAACCQILDTELGVPPDETTTALYEQIRAGGLDKEQRGGGSLQPSIIAEFSSATTLPHNTLPAQSTPFVGREVELTQIGDLLSNPDCRLLSLLGLGGIGKSRLAIEAARRKASAFASGVCFVALAPLVTADFVLVAIAQSLGLPTISGDLRAQVLAYLRQRTLLLVLDDFEHL
ncbi:MAG: BTAD domain-containing putative transcriptional regulator, partial [Caldilinea sp.]